MDETVRFRLRQPRGIRGCARRVPGHLGSTIRGSFQDELQAMPLWSPDFEAAFALSNGYDIVDHLPALWENWGEEARLVRINYQSTRAALAESAFFQPLNEWHTSRGMLNGCDQMEPARGGHVGAGVAHYGDYFSTHRWYTAPGSDHWGDAGIHDSMARLHGGSRVWIEGFHSTGWGGTLEETIDSRTGVNTRCSLGQSRGFARSPRAASG